jgi:hypothetical protein
VCPGAASTLGRSLVENAHAFAVLAEQRIPSLLRAEQAFAFEQVAQ